MALDKEADLRRALHGGDEIVPYFQPLVELRTGQLTGFEVLARWHHPVRGLVSPSEFIPLAESANLIDPLLHNLLHGVFAATTTLPDHLTLSVNISPIQLQDPALARQMYFAAQDGGFPFHRIIFEITESALVDNISQASLIAQELKSLGARLALDDFGTGYSSLHHLQSLPVDEIKIESSFVRSMIDSRESRKIVSAVVGLGNSLGLVTVAEGIETREQADMLLLQGCDFGQGTLYGSPAPPSKLDHLITVMSQPESAILLAAQPAKRPHEQIDLRPNQQHAQLQAIYDGAPVGLCFLNRQLRYVSINQRLADINKLPVSAHIGRHISDILPQMFQALQPSFHRAFNGEAVSGVQYVSLGPSPGNRGDIFLVSCQPAHDEAGEVVGISVSLVDITEHKRSEETLRQTRPPVDLEQRWASGTDSGIFIIPRRC
jgi:EAL domain-containing protein (putative c-di-GMP-specific phosphodiesterase class I)